jgi:hemoglobin
MRRVILPVVTILALGLVASPAISGQTATESARTEAATIEKAAPTADEQVTMLESGCELTAEARDARHTAKPLFERLGGEEGIHAITKELVRVHMQNEKLAYMFEDLDGDHVANRVALFMISGTGGPALYDGPSLPESHAHMGLTNTEFLLAGGDMIQAMKNLGYGADEIDEVICILVSLRDQVVLDETPAKATSKQ